MMRGGRGEESGKGDLIVKCVLCMYYTLCAGACVRANALRIVSIYGQDFELYKYVNDHHLALTDRYL